MRTPPVAGLVLLAVLLYLRAGSPTQAQSSAPFAAAEGRTIDGIRCQTMEHASWTAGREGTDAESKGG